MFIKFTVFADIELEHSDFCGHCRFNRDYDMSTGSHCILFDKELTEKANGTNPYDAERLQECKSAERVSKLMIESLSSKHQALPPLTL